MNLSDIVLRMKKLFGKTEQKEIADLLNMSQQNLGGYIRRNSIPCNEILEALKTTKHDLRYVFYGEETPQLPQRIPNVKFYDHSKQDDNVGSIDYKSGFADIYIDPAIFPLEDGSGSLSAIRVNGEAMGSSIKSGSIIFVDRNRTAIIDGRVFVIEINGMNMIRRIYNSPNGFIIKSDNQDFPQFEVSANEFSVLGLVISKLEDI